MGTGRTDRALAALLAGFAALTAIILGAVWFAEQQGAAAQSVRHTLEVDNRVGRVEAALLQAETSQRGFLVTRSEPFLRPYRGAVETLERELAALEQSVSDNPAQVARARRLRLAAQDRLQLLDENLARFRAGEPVTTPSMELGRGYMEDARRTIAEMQAEEERLLAVRVEGARRQATFVRLSFLLAGVAVILLGAFAFLDARRRLRLAVATGESLAEANAHLKTEAASRAAAEAQVRQFQKIQAIGQLTGGIAHDFNNMLAIVIGSLDLAKRRLKADPERAEACIDNALDGANRAAQLTSRLLAFSRQQPLAPQVLDVNRLVGGMSELLRRTLGENVQVETVLAGGLWRTHVDAAQLENAIVNLCVNARDAMGEGGKLTIETSNAHLDDAYAAAHPEVEPGQYVMISVSDTGEGMPADVIERAFDPFFTTKGVGRGTGLGLSQVHGFVKQTNGHVKIYSELGVGTTIKIYLPRNTGELSAADAMPPASELPTGRGEIILVVEDDDRVRHLSVEALRELGYTVIHAASAAQALTTLETLARVDLLFTDVVMPDISGRRLADQARATRPDLKVLYTTGYTKNAIVHNGMLDADVAFLAKPFTIEQLAQKVRQVLDAA